MLAQLGIRSAPQRLLRLAALTWALMSPVLADAAPVLTILEGKATVLRATTWLKLVEGAPLQEGDIIDATDKTQLQLELPGGSALSYIGPGILYVTTSSPKPGTLVELFFTGTWVKLATGAKEANLRVVLPTVSITAATPGAAAVARSEGRSFGIFVETGSVQLSEPVRGRSGAPQMAKAGEYWSLQEGKSLAPAGRPPQGFIAAMPRAYQDTLPNRLARFNESRVELTVDHEVTYQEAKPWLTGGYRRSFTRRFQPKLKDSAFRQGVEADIRLYPEWDRILHPEKYLPKETVPIVTPSQGVQK